MSATFNAPVFESVLKKMIFASWPPSSMAVPTVSYVFFNAMEFATTSWI